MKKKDLLRKQELAEDIGMKFDEVSELFSEETLGTMKMMNIVGGNDDSHTFCGSAYCGNCVPGCDSSSAQKKCDNKTKQCDKNGDCGVEVKPDVKVSCPTIGGGTTKPPVIEGPTTPPGILDLPTLPPGQAYA